MTGDDTKTLALIKPDAIQHAKEILVRINQEGFTITHQKQLVLTREDASDFYGEHYGRLFFPSLVAHMSSGPIIAMCLSRPNAVQHWRDVLGPTKASDAYETHPNSIRAKYAHPTRDVWNAAHGSDSPKSAQRELQFFFPELTLEPLLSGEESSDYIAQNVTPTLTKGLVQLCKEKPGEPIIWLANWLQQNNPNRPGIGKEIKGMAGGLPGPLTPELSRVAFPGSGNEGSYVFPGSGNEASYMFTGSGNDLSYMFTTLPSRSDARFMSPSPTYGSNVITPPSPSGSAASARSRGSPDTSDVALRAQMLDKMSTPLVVSLLTETASSWYDVPLPSSMVAVPMETTRSQPSRAAQESSPAGSTVGSAASPSGSAAGSAASPAGSVKSLGSKGSKSSSKKIQDK